MYIRKVTTRKTKGKVYYSYRLVEAERMPNGKVQQQALLNLGASYHMAEEDWPLLSDRVRNILCGGQLLRWMTFPNASIRD